MRTLALLAAILFSVSTSAQEISGFSPLYSYTIGASSHQLPACTKALFGVTTIVTDSASAVYTGAGNGTNVVQVVCGGTSSAPAWQGGTAAGVSCAANTVSLTTLTVTNGVVTHC